MENTTFVRFGGVNLKTQKGYRNRDLTYHTPPARRGFYAFPKTAQELFLIGSLGETQQGSLPKDESNLEEKEIKSYWRLIRREFVKTKGNLWHHLEEFCCEKDIIATHGSWVKTSIAVWKKAFSKMKMKLRFNSCSPSREKCILHYYGKDSFEVFIDEKV